MFLMELGELPRADVAIFADPGWEGKAVYDHLDWLRRHTTIPIITVSKGNILQDAQDAQDAQVRGKKQDGVRWASMPLYVLNDQRIVRGPGLTLWGLDEDEYTINLAEPEEGKIKRQCTTEYKLEPIEKWIKEHILDLKTRQHWPKEPEVIQVFGISHDEKSRMKAAPPWAMFEYPLVEMRWNRLRVIDWAQKHFPDHEFPRSACIGCPFHDNAEWRRIRDTDPTGWAQAVALDEKIRNAGGMRGEVYLHRSCTPL